MHALVRKEKLVSNKHQEKIIQNRNTFFPWLLIAVHSKSSCLFCLSPPLHRPVIPTTWQLHNLTLHWYKHVENYWKVDLNNRFFGKCISIFPFLQSSNFPPNFGGLFFWAGYCFLLFFFGMNIGKNMQNKAILRLLKKYMARVAWLLG